LNCAHVDIHSVYTCGYNIVCTRVEMTELLKCTIHELSFSLYVHQLPHVLHDFALLCMENWEHILDAVTTYSRF